MDPKPTTAPPAREYRQEIDTRPLFSPALSSDGARAHILISSFHQQRDKRREPALTGKSLAAIMGGSASTTNAILDELGSSGILDGSLGWATVIKPVVGGDEAKSLKVSHRPPQLTKIDTRPFFTRGISAGTSRLWAVATILASEGTEVTQSKMTSELQWTESKIDEHLRELAGIGLAKLTIGAEGTAVHALKLSPTTELGFVEFTCKELGRDLNERTLGSKRSTSLHTARKEECARRAASRRSS